jgi:hypothetical protein
MFKRLLTIALVLAIASLGSVKASAASVPVSAAAYTAQSSTPCTDADFMTSIGKDMTDIGTQFKAIDVKDVVATSQLFLALAGIRQKYEDMTVANECLDLKFDSIIAFSNASDILALALAAQTDTANADAYNKVMPDQLTRFQGATQNVLIVAGIATPAADATPIGRISSITSAKCEDADFLTALSKDLESFSQVLTETKTDDLTSTAQSLLVLSILRQQWEDAKVPSGCEITQLLTIMTLSNATDLMGLALAAKADTKNAEAYTAALDRQSTRTQELLKQLVTAAGGATPEATEAAS